MKFNKIRFDTDMGYKSFIYYQHIRYFETLLAEFKIGFTKTPEHDAHYGYEQKETKIDELFANAEYIPDKNTIKIKTIIKKKDQDKIKSICDTIGKMLDKVHADKKIDKIKLSSLDGISRIAEIYDRSTYIPKTQVVETFSAPKISLSIPTQSPIFLSTIPNVPKPTVSEDNLTDTDIEEIANIITDNTNDNINSAITPISTNIDPIEETAEEIQIFDASDIIGTDYEKILGYIESINDYEMQMKSKTTTYKTDVKIRKKYLKQIDELKKLLNNRQNDIRKDIKDLTKKIATNDHAKKTSKSRKSK